ncbi:hypothetical protein AZH53_00790 [Methanomicrobiaceae archaeon CYW5]|uniref:hypothetical protein n=1 Tax=Methanovulcanius yangii TaxID=1789227 RepID=UPI0029CA3403|nr:hypothetical protein [Methanovulcanius yangii]MBT8506965.1 hypothetical protein [Methanovulcanius yangii]
MNIWNSVVAVAFLCAVIGSAVCPCAGAVAGTGAAPAPDASSSPSSPPTVQSDKLNGLPMADLIGGPLSAVVRAQERMAATTTAFLESADLEEFADGPLDMSMTLQQTL